MPQTLVVATHNLGKLGESNLVLGELGVSVRTPAELTLPAPRETEDSYRGNAVLKARAAAMSTGLPVLADDTGFEADALGAAPGVHTARWAEAHGGYPAALRALIERAGPGTRGRLVCAVAFVHGDDIWVAEATVEGTIRERPTDAPGFAAVLLPDDGAALLRGGVLAHRRAAFAQLTSR
jgi:XTP/dITP diphosphohydrolase